MNPKIYLIGNAHLDPAWLWQWQEGFSEIKATFRSALDRMKEFDGYIFTAAGASYYQWVEENEPKMFEEIRQRVAEGRWILAGGWWLQPDCNLPCGESFARHGLYGQRYFLSRFGRQALFGYNVDSFGHNGALPQLLSQCGMNSYIMMRPEQHEKQLDSDTFLWEGIDGTRILTYRIPRGYGTSVGDGNFAGKYQWFRERAEGDGQSRMLFYGVGNHGGGPTISLLHQIEDLKKEDPQLCYGNPAEFFEEMREKGTVSSVVRGDLQHHAIGCYSACREIKRGNCRSERKLLAAERMMTVASRVQGLPYRQEDLHRGWEDVLFNQFHDILGGCSLKKVYDDAREFHGEAMKIGSTLLNASLQRLSWHVDTLRGQDLRIDRHFDWNSWEYENGGTPVVIFNINPWEVQAEVPLSREITGALDEEDRPLVWQRVRADQTCNHGRDDYKSLLQITLPPMGYRTVFLYRHQSIPAPESGHRLQYGSHYLENDWYRLEFDAITGTISRLWDKTAQREILDGNGALAEVISDYHNDTWAHGAETLHKVAGYFGDASLSLLERGPIRAVLRAVSYYRSSTLTQDFILYRDRPGIDVRLRVNWQEPFCILKLAFPVRVSDPSVLYEIPYGSIRKPTDGKEEPALGWINVSGKLENGEEAGLSIASEYLYSCSAEGNTARFIVVRSAGYADHYGIKDEFTEAMDLGIYETEYSLLPYTGSFSPAQATRLASEHRQPPVTIYETYHKGELPLQAGFASSTAENVLIEAVKQAEDGNGIIVRAYEADGKAAETVLSLPFAGTEVTCTFRPYEIQTIRISDSGEAEICSILETPIEKEDIHA
ncbi:MAG: alpha-mannosidase [Candidatus Merdivicinus sp.]|jgi:alpha-mannosidase